MITIERDGKTTVITGWRAWLIYAAVAPFIAVVIVLALGLLFGIALTIGTVVLFAIPVALVVALLAYLLFRKEMSGTHTTQV
jgi:hypothetical protein